MLILESVPAMYYAVCHWHRHGKVKGERHGLMASKSSVSFLPKVMLIKDQINVAYLLTSAKKIMKDRLRYNIHSDNDDKIKYRHYNRL